MKNCNYRTPEDSCPVSEYLTPIEVFPGDVVICYVRMQDNLIFENPYPKAEKAEDDECVQSFTYLRPATAKEIAEYERTYF